MSKEQWKYIICKKITEHVLVELSCENNTKSHTHHHPEHKILMLQDYFSYLSVQLMQVKSPYQYAEGDVLLCRLCGKVEKTNGPCYKQLLDAAGN